MSDHTGFDVISNSAGSGGPSSHVVQFYEDEDVLCETVASFVADGLNAGEPVLVIATAAHRELLLPRLAERGLDARELDGTGRLTLVDAHEALSAFMVGDTVDAARFRASIGGIVADSRAGRDGTKVRAYGEMVDVLSREGNPEAAIRVEDLCNELAAEQPLSLLCVYSMDAFGRQAHGAHFDAVCRRHARVIPTERCTQAPDRDARLHEVSGLQQKTRALEAEVEDRKQLEQVLRQALEDRQRAEIERERLLACEQVARAEAEAANRSKDEFLAILSHELRTPLNAILGWTHIANEPASEEATLRRALAIIERNARLQLRVIDDLLDVSRIVTGKLRVRADRVDLGAVLRAAVENVRSLAQDKTIDVRLEIDVTACDATGDAGRLQQVVWNLLSNAVKFTPPGGSVDVRLERAGPDAQVVVRDTGQGIAPAFLPYVFDRFRQGDTGTTRRHGGLGLGLAVVRHLVEAHGGTVAADSAGEGCGSAFTVRLPLRGAVLPER